MIIIDDDNASRSPSDRPTSEVLLARRPRSLPKLPFKVALLTILDHSTLLLKYSTILPLFVFFKRMQWGLGCALVLLAVSTDAANILAVFPHTGKSHYFMFRPFVLQLTARGHQVTVITHFPDQSPPPNVTFVDIRNPDGAVLFNSFDIKMIENATRLWSGLRPLGTVKSLYDMGIEVCRKGLAHPNLQKFLKQGNQFDLAIIEFFNTDCFASLAHVFDVPIIGMFPSVMMPWHNERFANPNHPAFVPSHFLQLPSHMTLYQRIQNTLMYVVTDVAYRWIFNPAADALVAQHIGPNVPPVSEIVNNASLLLVNTHFSLFQPRPFVPAVVELGGFHVIASVQKNIPQDILKWFDGAEHGVVVFSMGSTILTSSMPEEKVRIFQRVLGRLKQRVLWKWELPEMPNKPENVFISKWFPQNDILGHKKVRVFMTHSGLMGTEEAVYHGVPMLMMPIFGDQPVNAASCQEKGVGIIVDYFTLNEEALEDALLRLINDKTYAERSKKLSELFLDRPLTIMDTANYWTEYIIRHRGAPHLQSAATKLVWYQYFLLDVIAVITLVIYVCAKLIAFLLRAVLPKRVPKPKAKKS